MADDPRGSTGASPYTALLATIGTGVAIALVVLAIGFVADRVGSESAAGASDPAGAGGTPGDHAEIDFGEPGDPAAADRVVEMKMLDSLAFEPSTVEVSQGETITFSVTNTGKLLHDFTLGNEAAQEAHSAEMADMGPSGEMGGGSDPNAMKVEPGEPKELTWTFTEPGDLLIVCQIPGHAEAGMVADVVVT